MEAKQKGDSRLPISNPLAFVRDPFQFNQKILDGRIKQFKEASNLEGAFVFLDRGIPDVMGYMDFFSQQYDAPFENAGQDYRYDMVFLLPPWQEIYVSDNERLESFEEATEIHRCLKAIYTRFDYSPVTVPKDTVEERTAFILHELNATS